MSDHDAAAAAERLEIERKFLLDQLPRIPRRAEIWRIEQGYFKDSAGRLRRITLMDGRIICTHTIKQGRGITRIETERNIEAAEFEQQWPLTEGRRLQKKRFRVAENDLIWEIDEFADVDLVLAEVELPTPETPVPMPDWIGRHVVREVTDDPAFTNAQIARRVGLIR